MTSTVIVPGVGAIRIYAAAYHRNGSGGAGFYVIRFREGRGERRTAIVFDAPGRCAVIEPLRIEAKFRGDLYEIELKAWIVSPEGEAMIWGERE